jgi:hypothetical protein
MSCFRLVTVIASLILLSSCATITPVSKTASTSTHTFVKNYSLGEAKKAYIGEEIIKVKDYYVVKSPIVSARAENDIEVKGGFTSAPMLKGTIYRVVGEMEDNGRKLKIITSPLNNIRIALTETGHYADIAIGHMNQRVIGVSFEPSDAKFAYLQDESIDSSRTFINYEIIFTGISDQALNLLYREYTPDNMARSAFFQNLTYPRDSKTIRFKQTLIRVDTITNELISYTVLEDGLSK